MVELTQYLKRSLLPVALFPLKEVKCVLFARIWVEMVALEVGDAALERRDCRCMIGRLGVWDTQ